MNRKLQLLAPLAIFVFVAIGCQVPGPETRTFDMSNPDVDMEWVVTRDQELACNAPERAGGAIAGEATFGVLGALDLAMSAAWDIGAANPDPDEAEYVPESPHAAGPFAPVLGQDAYPYRFAFDPATTECDGSLTATGELELTAGNGDTVIGLVTGGETHRLDVAAEGDGIEVFAEIEFDGGTGEFTGATGSAVLHLITHFDFGQQAFVIDTVEVLPGGTIRY